jgi:hypothetical protein
MSRTKTGAVGATPTAPDSTLMAGVTTEYTATSAKLPTPVYAPRPVKRQRRTGDEIKRLKREARAILRRDQPMSVRAVFYRMVSAGHIDKTELEYKKLGRYLLQMRRQGEIPYGWIVDGTRWQRGGLSYPNLLAALVDTKETYRRAVWRDQGVHVEVWVEKEALADTILTETRAWDVPLLVSRGFSSESFLFAAAEAIRHRAMPAYVYLLTDYDPAGFDIAQSIERGLRRLAPDVDLTIELLAVTTEQIHRWSLPTRPTKKSDSRAKGFIGESVDLDAIPAPILRALVRGAVEAHIDEPTLARTQLVEAQERETFAQVIDAIGELAS